MRIVRTFGTLVLAAASACSPATTGRATKSDASALILKHIPTTPSGIQYTPEQLARLNRVKPAGQDCSTQFNHCVGPENTCSDKRQKCMDEQTRALNIQHFTLK